MLNTEMLCYGQHNDEAVLKVVQQAAITSTRRENHKMSWLKKLTPNKVHINGQLSRRKKSEFKKVHKQHGEQ